MSLSRLEGIHHLIKTCNNSRQELGMWIDHFLVDHQMTALNAQKIGRLTHLEMNALVSAKQHAVDASIRRKLKKIKEQEDADLKKEAAIFEMFM